MSAETTAPAPDGIDAERVTAWFGEHVPAARPPLEFSLIAGGHSNLTYTVTDATKARWVLRRPPLGHVLATAHDMGREHRIISALGPTDVPVPPAVGHCADEDVNDAPFYVMEFVDGHVIRGREEAEAVLDEPARERAGESLVEVLTAVHSVDLAAVGLDDLGRHDGYLARQLKRWNGQFEQSKTREIPAMDRAHELLVAAMPDQVSTTIVHGDYRLDNCMLDDRGAVVAVLDWEICTLGDPLADVGLLMVYWPDADDPAAGLLGSPTALAGFPSRRDLLERYSSASGRDLSAIDYYVAFGYWKLAAIIEGVYARYAAGAMGEQGDGFQAFADMVVNLAEQSVERVEALA